jgi:lycopene beta-cyclase
VAGQAAYGVVGRFEKAPVEPGQFVLMDFRCDHLSEEQRQQPPTFLYAMDFGDGVFFSGGNIVGLSSGGAGS